MRKLFVTLAVVCLVLAGVSLVSAATAKEAPKDITISDCQAKQPAVAFPHGKHQALDCKTCHHTQADLKAGTDTVVQKCKDCHVAPEKAETPKCSEMSMTKNPFHISCVGCHKAEVAKNAAKPLPVKCADCHKKG